MVRLSPSRGALLPLLLLVCTALVGQESDTITRQRRLMLFFDFAAPRGYSETDRRLLYDSLLFKISLR